MLSAADRGGQGLHTRGNFEAYRHAASPEKWLEARGDTHWTEFYSSYGVDFQKRFFGHFLKGEDTGWDRQPRVLLNIRHPGGEMQERKANGRSNAPAGPAFIFTLSIAAWMKRPRPNPPR